MPRRTGVLSTLRRFHCKELFRYMYICMYKVKCYTMAFVDSQRKMESKFRGSTFVIKRAHTMLRI